MKKPLELGKCKVTFEYLFEHGVNWDNKKELAQHIARPRTTICKLEHDGVQVSSNISCYYKDHFSYEQGRKLALQKAFKETTLSKEERRQVWDDYNKLKPNRRW